MNGVKHDYCFRECILSMLRVCQEVVVGYAADPDGDDGTRDVLTALELAYGNRVVVLDHTEWMRSHKTGPRWVVEWTNLIRLSLKHPTQLWLDADEVLSDTAVIPEMQPTWHRRLNFWKDSGHLCPEGVVCASWVARSGPTEYWMPADDPNMLPGENRMIVEADRTNPTPEIFHYGFLRKPEAFLAKSRFFQPILIGTHDDRLKAAESDTSRHWTEFAPFKSPLIPVQRQHPKHALQWLADRGHSV